MLTSFARYVQRHHLALIALFAALGGTSYAAVTIDGARLKTRSVTAKKVKRDTLGGREVRESRLGTVPRAKRASSSELATAAARATSALTAGDAARLGGVGPGSFVQGAAKVRLKRADVRPGVFDGDFFVVPGLAKIQASCGPGATSSGYGYQRLSSAPLEVIGVTQETPQAGFYPDPNFTRYVTGSGSTAGGIAGPGIRIEFQLATGTGASARYARVVLSSLNGGDPGVGGLGPVCRFTAEVISYGI